MSVGAVIPDFHLGPDENIILEWLAAEHYRIHIMESWPDGARKEAGLAAARCALESLASTRAASSFTCVTCVSRRQTVAVIPSVPGAKRLTSGWAA
jgi:hypothetical protein